MIVHHYTCADAADTILADGLLRPQPFQARIRLSPFDFLDTGMADAPPVVWLTDLAEPDKDRLGLHSLATSCDRAEVRFTVDVDVERWKHFARRHGAARRWRRMIERGSDPFRWWVTSADVPVGPDNVT